MIAERRRAAKKNEEVWLQYHWAAPPAAAERNETNNARLISLARLFPSNESIYIFLIYL